MTDTHPAVGPPRAHTCYYDEQQQLRIDVEAVGRAVQSECVAVQAAVAAAAAAVVVAAAAATAGPAIPTPPAPPVVVGLKHFPKVPIRQFYYCSNSN